MKQCVHSGLRQHTFTDGKTVKLCPSCPEFDEERRKVLNPKSRS
jgi:hypothetical protein